MDVFRGWHNYAQRLEDNWRRVVQEGDTVVIAGDISWAMKLEDALQDFQFLHSLPGREDTRSRATTTTGGPPAARSTSSWLEHGFSDMKVLHNCAYQVEGQARCAAPGAGCTTPPRRRTEKIVAREAGRLTMSMAEAKQLGGELVAFLHYPPVYDTMECQELLDLLAANQESTAATLATSTASTPPRRPWSGSIKGCTCASFPPTMSSSARSGWSRPAKLFHFFPKYLRESCRFFVTRVCYNHSSYFGKSILRGNQRP